MSIAAVNPDDAGRGTGPKSLNKIEATGQMSNLGRAWFLSLSFWGGFGLESDQPELKGYVMRDVIYKSDWFKTEAYLADPSYRHKVDAMIYTAIMNISIDELLPSRFIAEQMQITERAFNKTWKERYNVVLHQLDDWVIEAANRIHKNIRGFH
nr:hypothetical protein 4 [Piscirickettsiaceae bacterium]